MTSCQSARKCDSALTFDVQWDLIALGISLDVGGGARNISGHVTTDVL